MTRRTYATLSVLSEDAAGLSAFSAALPQKPTRLTERNGLHGAHYSTRDAVAGDSLEMHLRHLLEDLAQAPEALAAAGAGRTPGFEVRLWAFHDSRNENEDFLVSSQLIRWLARMDADLCVDIWRSPSS